jgi:hypothetical protein
MNHLIMHLPLSICAKLIALAWSQFTITNKQHQGHDDPTLFFASSHVMGVAIKIHNK